ncbi:hypothetical protein [Brevundimonas nasdae]|uniref:Uncharacterized protein n=1 Tax=Brevundimonas nasdae TaxID=172043 RepID=A0ACD4VKB5_9CAUL|nr:hypothetical protein [Brevundimonas nasdae]WOB78460.1 hypothetical protein PZA08_14320 [Brevundimonas nasdae]
MDAKRAEEIGETYRGIMADIKVRMLSINQIIRDPGHLHPRLVKEYCFLQLRKIIELVALGCVVAHDDLVSSKLKRLRKTYHPDAILAALAGLEDDFFPRAVVVTNTPTKSFVDDAEEHGLTADELRKMWGVIGAELHSGTVDKLNKQADVLRSQPEVRAHQRRLVDLLSHHMIMMANRTQTLICVMESTSTKELNVVFGEAIPADES